MYPSTRRAVLCVCLFAIPVCFHPHEKLKLLFAAEMCPNHGFSCIRSAAIPHTASRTDGTWWQTSFGMYSKSSWVRTSEVWPLSRTMLVLHLKSSPSRLSRFYCCRMVINTRVSKMSGANEKKSSSGVMEWIGSACRFATDRNDFRRSVKWLI